MTRPEVHGHRAILVSWLAAVAAAGCGSDDSPPPPPVCVALCDKLDAGFDGATDGAADGAADGAGDGTGSDGDDGGAPDAERPEAGEPLEVASAPLTGCDPAHRAVALYPGAEPALPAPADAPMTCTVPTGHRAPFNTSLTVSDAGTLLFAPVNSVGVLRSTDNGMSWQGPVNEPPAREPDLWGHPWLWRDADSGRTFFTAYYSFGGPCDLAGTGHNYWYSDDDGQSWTNVPGGVGCGAWDWGKLITGPARTSASKQALEAAGYPNAVYFCAGGPTYALGPNRQCYRSLDGGKTFTRTKSNALDASRGQESWPNAGAVAPDGTLYIAFAAGEQNLSLTVSEDDGDSWKVIHVPGTAFAGNSDSLNFLSMNVTVDQAGNLYVVWVDDRDLLPYLAFSKDAGKSWSSPLMVGAPGVQASTCVNVSVKEPGYVAIAYYGSPQHEPDPGAGNGHQSSDGRPYDAYMTVSRDVFTDKPLFWSGQVNEAGKPSFEGITLLVSEYVGAPAFGPDGSIWAAFLHETDQGLVGRITPPPR